MNYIEDIQIFRVNMTFNSSNEVKKKRMFHEWRSHFFNSWDELKVMFTSELGIFFLLYTKFIEEGKQILYFVV